jgi:hypothetical protein
MFRWLTQLVWHDDFIGEIISGSGYVEKHAAMDKQRRESEARRLEHQRRVREEVLSDPFWARRESRRKRELLELELEDAEWILNYEKRLAALQKETAAQRSKGEQSGINTERLRKLEHHLAGLRRSLD